MRPTVRLAHRRELASSRPPRRRAARARSRAGVPTRRRGRRRSRRASPRRSLDAPQRRRRRAPRSRRADEPQRFDERRPQPRAAPRPSRARARRAIADALAHEVDGVEALEEPVDVHGGDADGRRRLVERRRPRRLRLARAASRAGSGIEPRGTCDGRPRARSVASAVSGSSSSAPSTTRQRATSCIAARAASRRRRRALQALLEAVAEPAHRLVARPRSPRPSSCARAGRCRARPRAGRSVVASASSMRARRSVTSAAYCARTSGSSGRAPRSSGGMGQRAATALSPAPRRCDRRAHERRGLGERGLVALLHAPVQPLERRRELALAREPRAALERVDARAAPPRRRAVAPRASRGGARARGTAAAGAPDRSTSELIYLGSPLVFVLRLVFA